VVRHESRVHSFSTVACRESDPDRRPCQPRRHRALEQPLRVDREVEPTGRRANKLSEARPRRTPGALAQRRSPGSGIDRHDFVDPGVQAWQVSQPRLDDPRKSGARPLGLERRDQRERIDDIPERAQLDQSDPERR